MKTISFIIIAIALVSCGPKKTDVQIKLEREIESTFSQFEEANNGFIFDVMQGDDILIQAVHTSFLDTTSRENEAFGFGITLAFNVLDAQEFSNQQAFEKSLYHDEFIYYEYDGIMCYILDIDGSPERGAKILSNLLTDIHNVQDSSAIDVAIYNQGRIEKRENSK